ncbi:MAG: FAD-binding oxidoreductase [Phycisphaeraceae bacterium]|nr:FAD-binding oxidoreductase [Phycisphaeraceae bacterium]
MTVPYWRCALRPADAVAVDAVVVGAGVCGVSAALRLERRGLRVAVVEARGLGAGASSRNAGFLMRGAADHYADVARRYGRETARMVWRWTEENLAALREEGIEELASYRRVPSCLLALSEGQAEELQESRRMMEEDGFEVPWVESGDDSAWRAAHPVGGLVNPADAAANPVEVLGLLASKVAGPILANEEVYGIEGGPGEWVVRTASLRVAAAHVVVCTNAYAGLVLPGLAGVVRPNRGQMLAVRNPSRRVSLAHSYYVNHGSEYFRQTAEGSIVVGGCRTYFAEQEAGYGEGTSAPVQAAIEAFASRMLGPGWDEGGIIARWAGTMGFSPDGLPLVGPVGGGQGPWFCGGFTGHGMSMAFVTARAAVDAMLDGTPAPFPLARVAANNPA